MNFGEQIKRIRKEQNMTQQEMADKLNVSRQAVSNWENDKNLPDIEMLITMAQVFHLTLDELILGGSQMNNMTEKLIQDGSTNSRIKMNLLGIRIGGAMLALGFISLLAGAFAPPSAESYWSIAFTALMFGGLITFFVIGVKHVVELFRNRKQQTEEQERTKPFAVGGILMLAGIIAYAVTLLTGAISGLLGLLAIIAGIGVILVAALTSR